jgi:hypothetical protein
VKKIPLFYAFFLVLAVSAGAQDNNGFNPVVSNIRAEARNNLIRLTWMDSPDARGPVYIFRSTRPFSGSIPANIRPVIVRYGDEYYVDDTEDLVNLYYFIAASDASGRRYDIIIAETNSTNVNLTAGEDVPPDAAVAAPVEPIQGISNLRANQDGEKVTITFDVTGPRKPAVLYRSMNPVKQPQDLLNAVIVHSGADSPITDYPVPGLSWYYALIYEDEISAGNMGIRPGINATVSSVVVTGGRASEMAIRPMPLPAMTLNITSDLGMEGGSNYFLSDNTRVNRQMPLREETSRMLRNSSLPPKAPLELRKPRIFTIDLQAPSGGEDSALFQIVNEYFVKRDWEVSRNSLLHYLSLPRSKDVEARARFYLGQTLYFTGNYRGALFEFLTIRPVHPVEANIWIDTILEAMVY